jgi:signal transduction histidine kinase
MILNSFRVDPDRLKIVILSTPKTGNTWLRWLLHYAYGIPIVELPPEWAPGCADDLPPRFVTHQHLFPSESLVQWLVREPSRRPHDNTPPRSHVFVVFSFCEVARRGVGPDHRNAKAGRGPSRKKRAEIYHLLVSSELCHFARLAQAWVARASLRTSAGRSSVATPRGHVQDRATGRGETEGGGLSAPFRAGQVMRLLFDLLRVFSRANRVRGFDSVIVGPRNLARFTLSRKALVVVCLLLVGIVGYVDYLTGYERSLLLFYLLPISLAAWFGSLLLSLAIVVISVAVWKLSDLAAGIPAVGFWNAGMAFFSYALFASVLSRLRRLVLELDRRVHERTAALQREVVERQRLDREIAQVADRERRRLGQDLHDRLGQHLTGTALAAQVLKEKLAAKSAPEVMEAEKLVHYVEEGIDLTRNLARGFFSPELEADGLSVALEGLAENISERFGVNCIFHEEGPIPIRDPAVATQLYRVAQEAATNAAKHAAAEQIDIRISVHDSELTLAVMDDGVGFPGNISDSKGLGLRLMRHGATLIGGTFNVRRNGQRGTIAICKVTIPNHNGLNFSQ